MNTNNPETKQARADKRPSGAELRAMLMESNFGQPPLEHALPVSDPTSITQMVLKLHEITAYDKNPRQKINPEYSGIKSSIRNQRGLNNPFNVTRRPGAEHYMVQAGGNTRLSILRELYAETGDEAFNTVHCLFVPWKDEASIITAHMVENELRGEMALIDKAYGIRELRIHLEQQQGSALSDREFVKRVTALGYRLASRQLRTFSYALVLDKLIPLALREGITHRQLDTIKNTEKAYLMYCEGKIEQMPEIFARTLAAHDGESFDFEQVRTVIEDDLGERLGLPGNRLSLQIDVLMIENLKNRDTLALLSEPLEEYPDAYPLPPLSEPQDSVDTHPPDTAPARQAPVLQVVEKPEVTDAGTAGHDLAALQQQSFRLAAAIANSVNMAHLILQRSAGMGFVIEMPDAQPQNFSEWGIWWLLAGISEQAAGQGHMVLWKDTKLYKLYADGATNARDFLGDPPNLQDFPFQVLNDSTILGAQAYKALIRLMDTCRLIRAHFTADRLWPEA